MAPELRKRIEETIKGHKVVIFIKGTPEFPQCGFSAVTVEIFDRLGVPYAAMNVLADPSLREGIKEFSKWPTIPQVYVDGQFIGGCDIAREMYANGELEKLVEPFQAAG